MVTRARATVLVTAITATPARLVRALIDTAMENTAITIRETTIRDKTIKATAAWCR